jgi:hypothetical protein
MCKYYTIIVIILFLSPSFVLIGQSRIADLHEIGIKASDINYLPGTFLRSVHQGMWKVSCYEGMTVAINETTRIIDTLFISFKVATQLEDSSACFWEEKYKTLSLVGPYVSYELDYDNDCGGPHPNYGGNYTTIELGTHRLVSLDEIFPEASIIQGLVCNESLMSRLRNKKPKCLAEIQDGQPDTIPEDWGGRLDFYNFKFSYCFGQIVDNKVTVIFGLNEEKASSRGMLSTFEIQIIIPADKLDMFHLAKINRTLFVEPK